MATEFGFTVTLSDTKLTGKYGDMEFKEGVATFKLKSGESKSATGLPEGTTYTVTEAEANAGGFSTTSTGATGKLELGKTATAAFVNSRPSGGYGRLSVHKTVLSNNSYDRNRLFNFRVRLSDPTVNGVYGDMMFVLGTATFTLAGGQTRTAVGLPLGVAYTVDEAEANSDGFTTTAIGATGRVTAMGSTAVFTNTKNDYNRRNTNVSLRARKNLTGRALKSGEFSFTLKEGSRTLQTKTNDASGNVSFDTIEYTSPGTYTYTIEEVRGNDATVTYDTHAARVTVRVTEDSNGNLSASATYDSSSGATFNNTAGKVPPTPTPTPGTPAATPATQATVTLATVTPSTVLTSLPSRLAVTADPTAVLPVLALAAVGSAAAIGGLARRRRRK